MDVCDIPPTLPSTALTSVAAATTAAGGDEELSDLNLYKGCFRELQCHTFKILRYDLKLCATTVYKKTKLSDNLIPDTYTYKQVDKVNYSFVSLTCILCVMFV